MLVFLPKIYMQSEKLCTMHKLKDNNESIRLVPVGATLVFDASDCAFPTFLMFVSIN